MDVITKTGFGVDASIQTNPDNPFMKHALSAASFSGARSPGFLLSSQFLMKAFIYVSNVEFKYLQCLHCEIDTLKFHLHF